MVKAIRAGIIWVNRMQPAYVEAYWEAANNPASAAN
jgi:hypothetical protein